MKGYKGQQRKDRKNPQLHSRLGECYVKAGRRGSTAKSVDNNGHPWFSWWLIWQLLRSVPFGKWNHTLYIYIMAIPPLLTRWDRNWRTTLISCLHVGTVSIIKVQEEVSTFLSLKICDNWSLKIINFSKLFFTLFFYIYRYFHSSCISI